MINKKKCFVMKFSRAKKFDFPAEITIGDSEILQVKKVHQILGIMVQDNLKWQTQCEEMVRRATSTTWALRRMRALGVPEATLVDYWKSEGRVMLPGPLTAQSHSLDRAQRAAMAAITHPPIRRIRIRATFQQADTDLPDVHPPYGYGFETHGYVHPRHQC